MFKSGYITIIGRPNVGKSTLLNALLGQNIAAVSSRPQTTRHRILGIKHRPEGQLLFLDTPGVHRPHKSLNEYMMEMVGAAIDDADLFVFVLDPSDAISEADRRIYERISSKKKPILFALNKVDQKSKLKLLPYMKQCEERFHPEVMIPLSAVTGSGLDILEEEILKRLPEGPPYYPETQVTDQTERLIAADVIRSKVMEVTREEVPYSIAVDIETYEELPPKGEKRGLTRIRASIIVEKDSQKGIVIGKRGQMIKKIGETARLELESQLGGKLYLELFVRVEKEWSKNPQKIKEFGYTAS